MSSKKRKHQLALSELGSAVGPSSSGVSERQIQRDTAAIGGFAFSQTADNPAHMAAANAGLMRDAAMQPHLPTKYTQQHTEATETAALVGCNVRGNIQEVTALGAKVTATETQHKNSRGGGRCTGAPASFRRTADVTTSTRRPPPGRGGARRA
jgi:hypothetical protein